MSLDAALVADIIEADRIKSAFPQSGVSTDAIFLALRGLTAIRPRKGVHRKGQYGLPPQKFHDGLVSLKGQALTIGEFTMLAGMGPAGKSERNAIGAWLRTTGRVARKTGARMVFDI